MITLLAVAGMRWGAMQAKENQEKEVASVSEESAMQELVLVGDFIAYNLSGDTNDKEEDTRTVYLGEMVATEVFPDFPRLVLVLVCEDERTPGHYYARIKDTATGKWSEKKCPVYKNKRYNPNEPSKNAGDRRRNPDFGFPYRAPYHSWSHYILNEGDTCFNDNEKFHYSVKYYINIYEKPLRTLPPGAK